MHSLSVDSTTSRYLANVTGTPRPSRDEELELVRRWCEKQDQEAANRLTRAALRDAAFMALKYRHYGVPVTDLLAEGTLGVMRALEKYDPSRGTRFGTYASYWIRAYVVTHILKCRTLVGGASGALGTGLFFTLRRERAQVAALHGEGESADEILAERLGVSDRQLESMLTRLDGGDTSLDAPLSDDGSESPLDSLADEARQEDWVAQQQLRDKLETALSGALRQLDSRERFIITRRLLADDEDALSLADMGRHFGISRERVRQIEERAKRKLRACLQDVCDVDFSVS